VCDDEPHAVVEGDGPALGRVRSLAHYCERGQRQRPDGAVARGDGCEEPGGVDGERGGVGDGGGP
jgi:hypothetical protein